MPLAEGMSTPSCILGNPEAKIKSQTSSACDSLDKVAHYWNGFVSYALHGVQIWAVNAKWRVCELFFWLNSNHGIFSCAATCTAALVLAYQPSAEAIMGENFVFEGS
jgi:hypothetical protein